MKPEIIKTKTSALCFFPNDSVLCCKGKTLFTINQSGEIQKVGEQAIIGKTYGGVRLLNRLFRTGIRSAIALDNNTAILSIGNILVEYNIHLKKSSGGFILPRGVRPLTFEKVKNIGGFGDGIYFGGYLSNPKKEPVDVYCRIGVDKWEKVYTFPRGAINHIHNIISDKYRNCLWIFTGDFDEASAIWKVTDNFKTVKRIVCNDQKYRGCVVSALPEGLLYATDAPFADNFIYLLNPETMEVKELFSIDGSCIYGCQWKDKYVFSSTVEGDGRNTSRWDFYFGRKRGAGIKDDYVHMYMGDLQEGFKEIFKLKKDIMPFYTFQFGVFKFPYGVNNTDTLYFQPVATKKYDLDLVSVNWNNKQ